MFREVNPKQSFPKLEEEILAYWKDQSIFEKSLEQTRGGEPYVFYDGPPFATGLPHYGHLLPGTLKDILPRFQTMKGRYVDRRFGWDCHGLPVEFLVEKELGINGKKDIEERFGIAKFNEECRSVVSRYVSEWRELVGRSGRWVDMDNDYKTMEPWYMESIWWVVKNLWDKGLVYEGHKILHYCFRCSTPLSNFEAGLEYGDKQDPAVTVRFNLEEEFAGIKGVSLLVWTTTPWTLPSNVAVAVGGDIAYVLIKHQEFGHVLLASERLESYFKEDEYEIVSTHTGSELVGKTYTPLFDFFAQEKANGAFHVIAASYVTTTDGTGLVHQAPAFGEEDFAACREAGLPLVNPIDATGAFTAEVPPYQGKTIFEANPDIVKDLKEKGLLIRHETITHSVAHCWRCDTPLMYKAVSTWFVAVEKIKEKALAATETSNWMPEHVKTGRMLHGIKTAPDWAISRNRYWGTPLPVWRCEDETCGNTLCIGSQGELKEKMANTGQIIFIRHGEAEHNVQDIMNANPEFEYPLTELGKTHAVHAGDQLKGKIDGDVVVYASELVRTQETAQEILKQLGLQAEVHVDPRLNDTNGGIYDNGDIDEWRGLFNSAHDRAYIRPENGENYDDIAKRLREFLSDVYSKHPGKTVLVATHKDLLRMAKHIYEGMSYVDILNSYGPTYCDTLEYPLYSVHDLHKHFVDYLMIKCEKCGGSMKRITEVLDCWFESGSMPYAYMHYPFEHPELPEKLFPADFIAESQDQTRGWFYTLLVLSTALFDKPAFKNVIVSGMVLAEDGKKMSKKLQNYPEISHVFNTYGADSMRMYLMSSPAVAAQPLRFAERGVAEVVKNTVLPLWNTYSFFVTYANIDGWSREKMKSFHPHNITNELDKWLLMRVYDTVASVDGLLSTYDILKSTKILTSFIEDLTNWYIRRSRRRFWKSENDQDKDDAYCVLYTALIHFCQAACPIMPFVTDYIYRELTGEDSVHLSKWPKNVGDLIGNYDEWKNIAVLTDRARGLISLGHSIRAKKGIKVRQPLNKVMIAVPHYDEYKEVFEKYSSLILEELNIKEIELVSDPSELGTPQAYVNARLVGPKLGGRVQEIIGKGKAGEFTVLDDGRVQIEDVVLEGSEVEILYTGKEGLDVESQKGIVVALDTAITDELLDEGIARDIVRFIQDLRKEALYNVSDQIVTYIDIGEHMHTHKPEFPIRRVLEAHSPYIARETLSKDVKLDKMDTHDILREITIEEFAIVIALKKV